MSSKNKRIEHRSQQNNEQELALFDYYLEAAYVLGKDNPDKEGNERQAYYSLVWFYDHFCNRHDELNDLVRAFLQGCKLENISEADLNSAHYDEKNLLQDKLPNKSQKKAIRRALKNPVSIIQGPPGTGKTQTILHIVSCIIRQGKTVAVVSRNSEAIANIAEKIDGFPDFSSDDAGAENSQNYNGAYLKKHFVKLGNSSDRCDWSDAQSATHEKVSFEFAASSKDDEIAFVFDEQYARLRSGWEKNIAASDFLAQFPAISCTIHSLMKCFADGGSHQYDYVIMDESSQTDVLAGIVAMQCARHLVLVGDKEQLPPVFNSEHEKELNKLWKKKCKSAPDVYRMKENESFLSMCEQIFDLDTASVLLDEHYRCHPDIIGFCNQYVYNNRLNLQPVVEFFEGKARMPIRVLWYEGDYCESCRDKKDAERRSKCNMKQITVFCHEELPYLRQRLQENPDLSVCFLTPFRGQLNELQKCINNNIDSDFEALQGDLSGDDPCGGNADLQENDAQNATIPVLTIHKAQGKEFDIVYLFPVEDGSWEWPWSQQKTLINVAASRAKEELRIVLSSCLMKKKMQKELGLGGRVVPPRLSGKSKRQRQKESERNNYIQKLVEYVREQTGQDLWPEYDNRAGYPQADPENHFGFHRSKLVSIFDEVAHEQHLDKKRGVLSAPERCIKKHFMNIAYKKNVGLACSIPLRDLFVCNSDFASMQSTAQIYSCEDFDGLLNAHSEYQSHFDFVFFDQRTGRVLLAVEVDGAFHRFNKDVSQQERRDELDAAKDEFAQATGAAVLKGNARNQPVDLSHDAAYIFLRLPANGTTYWEVEALCEDLSIEDKNSVYTIEDLLDKQYHATAQRILVADPDSLFCEAFAAASHEAAASSPEDPVTSLSLLIRNLKERGFCLEGCDNSRVLNELLRDEAHLIEGDPQEGWRPTKRGKKAGIREYRYGDSSKPACVYTKDGARTVWEFVSKRTI